MFIRLLIVFLVLLIAGMAVLVYFAAKNANRRTRVYKSNLESNQKKLDMQTSRLNILTRAMPHLMVMLSDPKASGSWQTFVLDEARALLWADGGSYWKKLDKEQILELQVTRGSDLAVKFQRINVGEEEELAIGKVAKSRTPITIEKPGVIGESINALVFPLIVGNNLWGVYRFVRRTNEKMSARDMDLAGMFIKQVALVLENREMITNREKFYLELIQTLADTLETRDAANQGQTKKARIFARGIAEELDMPEQFIYYLEFAALMHDIGKIAIDENLLKKPGKLSDEEFAIIKKHPEIGHKILTPVSMLAPVAPMVLYHQEWFNGKGYPDGLIGEEIPLGARIVAVLDAWSSMTSSRPWRPALTREEATKEIKKGSGTQFDPKIVEVFLTVLEKKSSEI